MDKDLIALMVIRGGFVFSFGSLLAMDRLFKWLLGSKW